MFMGWTRQGIVNRTEVMEIFNKRPGIGRLSSATAAILPY